jgi:Ferritin-like
VGDRDRALDDPAVPVRAVLDRGTGLAGGGLPHHSPEPPLSIHLERCSIDLVAGTFMAIEKPETGGDPPEGDDYTTLGQLYAAITKGFETLNRTLGPKALFCGEPARQVTSAVWDESDIFAVLDLPTATKAIEEIVEQGEGTTQSEFDAEHELAHYWKFNQIVDRTIALGAVFPAVADPSTAQLPAGRSIRVNARQALRSPPRNARPHGSQPGTAARLGPQ